MTASAPLAPPSGCGLARSLSQLEEEKILLKPCPFCGGSPQLLGQNAPEFWVSCLKIGCKASTEGFGSKDRAIAAWNSRAVITAPPSEAIRIDEVALALLNDDRTRNGWPAVNDLTFLREEDAAAYRSSARAAIAAMLPEGWVPVPRVPTPKMIDRFVSRALCVSVHGDGGWSKYACEQWLTMIAAATSGKEGGRTDATEQKGVRDGQPG